MLKEKRMRTKKKNMNESIEKEDTKEKKNNKQVYYSITRMMASLSILHILKID